VLRAARPFRRLPLRDAVADASSTGNCVHQCGSGSDGEPEFRAAFSGRRRAAPALQWPAVAPATGRPFSVPAARAVPGRAAAGADQRRRSGGGNSGGWFVRWKLRRAERRLRAGACQAVPRCATCDGVRCGDLRRRLVISQATIGGLCLTADAGGNEGIPVRIANSADSESPVPASLVEQCTIPCAGLSAGHASLSHSGGTRATNRATNRMRESKISPALPRSICLCLEAALRNVHKYARYNELKSANYLEETRGCSTTVLS
jgi:hypothetical protein